MRSLVSHFRYTVRLLLKSPGFTITAVLILGLGIGLNTAIFSLINAVILKPLPYPNPERLVTVYMSFQNMEYVPLDYPDYEDLKAAQRSFDSMAAYIDDWMDVTGQGEAERLNGSYVSADMFKVSGRPFALGRGFTEDEDKSGGPAIVVLSEKFWRRHFNSDPSVIGTRLTVSGRTLEVIGVAPAQAFEWAPVDLYLPIHLMRMSDLHRRDQHEVFCLGRLKAGVDIARAQSELEIIQHNLTLGYPEINKGYQLKLIRQLDFETSPFGPTLWSLGGAVACLLLIATANIANLMSVRGLERRRMVTIRAALGAPRLALIGQQFSETATITLLGGLVGIAISVWATSIIKAMSGQGDLGQLTRFQGVRIDGATIGFLFAVTTVTALLCGLLPAWTASKTNLVAVLSAEGSKSASAGVQRQRIRSLLVIAQVAVTCTLLVGAGLLVRSLQMVAAVPLGFNPDHVVGAITYLSNDRYKDNGRVRGFYDLLLEKVRAVPGVTAAAVNDALPFRGYNVDTFQVPSHPIPGPEPICDTQTISSDYFHTLQIPLLQGRNFDSGDVGTGQQVVIIDAAIARDFFRDRNPIGEQISFGGHIPGYPHRTYTIVGVVGSVRVGNPDETQLPKFQSYFPYTQNPSRTEALVLRTTGDPRELIAGIRKLVASVDPDTTVLEVGTVNEWIGQFLAMRRIEVVIISFFSGAALLLAAIGLYGTLSYTVRQRRREIGVRIALGAQAVTILKLVVQHGFKIVGIGLVIGVLSALLLTRLIQTLLFGVSSDDLTTFGVAACVLFLTGLIACLLPALRAMHTDPIKVLKE
jgi:putative ABC transport system permease protein